jgi:hypothetical protein
MQIFILIFFWKKVCHYVNIDSDKSSLAISMMFVIYIAFKLEQVLLF